MLRLDRDRRAGPWLEWKVRLFTVGAVLALAGIYLEESWMVYAAIAVLAAGVGLRFFAPSPESPADEDEPLAS